MYNMIVINMTDSHHRKLTYQERLEAGLSAMFSDRSAEVIASEYGISRSYVYDLKKQAEEVLDYFVMTETVPLPVVAFDDNQIRKAVLSLSMNCGSSIEGIQRHLNDVYGIHVSIGKISEIITEASIKADDYLEEIDLSSIRQTANDEIFQGNQPILTSVDLESTYIINMCLCDDRSGISWENLMNDRKKQGLNPEISISDGGSGLLSGIPKAFPDIEQRKDIFHAEKDLGIEVTKFERAAYAMIEEEERMIRATSGNRVHKKTVQKLIELQSHIDQDLKLTDEIVQLYQWLKELLGFTGYSSCEVKDALHWICGEMLRLVPEKKSFRKQVHVFEDNIDKTVAFIHYLQRNIKDIELKHKWKKDSVLCLYQARSYYRCDEKRSEWDFHCDTLFGFDSEEREKAECELALLISNTYRASSMIENVNGRIRDYIDCKRSVPPLFFSLIQLYLNTKKYRRSEVPERRGKSPLELLTGKSHDSFYQILGIE